MTARPRHRLLIASTWQGAWLRPEDQTLLAMRLMPGCLLLAVDAPYHGDPPPPSPPGPTPSLWEHELVELFLAGPGDPHAVPYTEIELAPGGHHLVLQFAGVRHCVAEGLPLRFRARIDGRRWRGQARIPRELLPPLPWRGNAFAIHGPPAARRYQAAAPMPGPRPDFHQPHRFPDLSLGNPGLLAGMTVPPVGT
jgi:hypothetical protein